MSTLPQDTLSELRRDAEGLAHALEGPAVLWQPQRSSRRGLWWWSAVGGAAVTAGALIALALLPEPAAPDPTAVPAAPTSTTAAEPTATHAPARTADVAQGVRVEVSGGTIMLELRNAQLRQVAELLAQRTGTRVHGSEWLVGQREPVTLTWQGTSADQAWRALLGHGVSHAAACRPGGCELWIFGSSEARGFSTTARSPTRAATPSAVALHEEAGETK
jgi:hypothetical protein